MPEPVIAHVTLSTGEVVELRVQGWPEKPGAKLATQGRDVGHYGAV
jgi:hypothetical protein